ncbi:glutathione S-transferase family protein [Vibrio casei]|uniref:glutathione transferase n=1 Tax=Vibrio casei TaxID=673372 RepID=A0A368LLM0_9VIBR|nr:glutathione S-transferase family protein [Vibrio casei]RCS72810.1 glutathione S-transferase family protein [Vibrio casei]SJN39036.1 Glutathione S-transferase [Vibrio casei]
MITLHHLNQSRSKRIIWLLEELNVPYEIKAYQRDSKTNLAPAELKAIHPLGKSPVIQEDELVLAESGAITEYLAEKYAANLLVPAKNTPEYAHYLQWLHFAESSAALPLLLHYFVLKDGSNPEFLAGYSLKELHLILGYLNDHLSKSTWLVGEQFTAADILLSFIVEMSYKLDQLGDYPALQKYLAALHQRPAAQKAQQLEKEYDHS